MSAAGLLEPLEQQAALFAAAPNRFSLMKAARGAPAGERTLQVLRNHAFEGAASVLPAFLGFAGAPMRVEIGDYDDSLNLPEEAGDARLVWLDYARYGRLDDEALVAWIVGRLDALRAAAAGPLIVSNAPDAGDRYAALNGALAAWAERTPAAAVLRLDEIARRLGERTFDEARAQATGTRLGEAAILESARALAFEILAGFFTLPVKALAVDLDNTIYEGVLGEDGTSGVRLTADHAALQAAIVRWAERGVLVAVVSRNEAEDVAELFRARADFPLKAEHVSAWQVSWGAKSDAVRAAAKAFNIGPDAVLMIDDNLGELVEAGARVPGLRLLHAGPTAADAARALDLYPGLPRGKATFAGRAADIAANAEREALARELDEEEYLRALQAELVLSLDPAEDRERLAEISRKTNQFNLALARLDETAVDEYLGRDDRLVAHVRLSDRLADSGSVAALFARRDGDTLVVDELCISCRALGRRLEDVMVAEALRRGVEALGARRAAFAWRRGPRNDPALEWAARFTGRPLEGEEGLVEAPGSALEGPSGAPVTVKWTN
ncbi:HAD-IIIC family phosphatase [Phenylobacterium zucineum]|uniref:HAD-IIIC family phosphatase n=1 Tax=Phenylobacterium zucineum TaxID=284016 RepID=UPI0003089715|nr:HAD-IIIC family phosphatase [Phenylobacterium zucineum]